MLAARVLRKSGRFDHVITASDGTHALTMFQDLEGSRIRHGEAFPPMLVLLDVNMPRMGGFEFLAEFIQLEANEDVAPVFLMLTGSDFEDDRAMAAAYPQVKGFLAKPIRTAIAHQVADEFGS